MNHRHFLQESPSIVTVFPLLMALTFQSIVTFVFSFHISTTWLGKVAKTQIHPIKNALSNCLQKHYPLSTATNPRSATAWTYRAAHSARNMRMRKLNTGFMKNTAHHKIVLVIALAEKHWCGIVEQRWCQLW